MTTLTWPPLDGAEWAARLGRVKAISLWQPWASLVAEGRKTIETRPWRTSYRGPLAIHATASIPAEVRRTVLNERQRGHYHSYYGGETPILNALYDARFEEGGYFGEDARTLPLGAVVAMATLVDCVPTDPGCMDDFTSLGGVETQAPDCYAVTYGDEFGEWGGPNYDGRTWDLVANRPLGDFGYGRWLWLLDDIRPVDPPIPARGRQQLWTWDAAASSERSSNSVSEPARDGSIGPVSPSA